MCVYIILHVYMYTCIIMYTHHIWYTCRNFTYTVHTCLSTQTDIVPVTEYWELMTDRLVYSVNNENWYYWQSI